MNGSDTHIEIRLKIRGVETDLRRLGEQLESQEQTLAETLADRDRCFVELAELYLPELGREAVDALRERLPLVYRNARQKLDEKEAEGRSLERRAADNQARRSNLDEQLDGVTEKLEVKVRERQALRQAIRAELEANADYVGLARQDRRLSARLRQQRRRLEAARADLEEKGPAFEDDPLFSYLQARGYATPAYRGGFLTRRLDRVSPNGWTSRNRNAATTVSSRCIAPCSSRPRSSARSEARRPRGSMPSSRKPRIGMG